MSDAHHVADAQLPPRLGHLSIDADAMCIELVLGQASGFEKPRSPQPLVDSHAMSIGEQCSPVGHWERVKPLL